MKKTLLSGNGQNLTVIKQANGRLQAANRNVARLNLDGLSVSWQQVHLGPGQYAEGTRVGMHTHECIQLEYVLSGAFEFISGEQAEYLEPGMGLLIAGDVPHAWRCASDGQMLGGMLEHSGRRASAFVERLLSSEPLMKPLGGAVVKHWIEQLLELAVGPDGSCVSQQMGHVLGLLQLACLDEAVGLKEWELPTDDHHTRRRHACQAALAFLQRNYAHPLQLSDVAAHVGLSVRHLNRLFQAEYEETVARKLAAIRVSEAARTLIETDAPIKEIAFDCGFANPAHLSARFKARYGMTPQSYRDSCRA